MSQRSTPSPIGPNPGRARPPRAAAWVGLFAGLVAPLAFVLGAHPAGAITVGAFGPGGSGGSNPASGQTFTFGGGGDVFELDAYVNIAGQDLNGGAFGTSAQLSTDPLPAGLDFSFSSILSPDATDITLTYQLANNTGSDIASLSFFSYVDADIDEPINTFFNELASTSGVLAPGQSFEIDEPGIFFGDIRDNLDLGLLDDLNALGAPEDVAMALGFDLAVAAGEIASIAIQLSEDGDSIGSFAITQRDDDPASLDELTFSGEASVAAAGGGGAAGTLDLSELASLLALPFFTGEGLETELVVTNGLSEALTLHVNVIDGDPGAGWATSSFDCQVTARETTHFVLVADGDGTRIDFECSATGADSNSAPGELGVARSETVAARSGIFFVAIEQAGATVSKNAVFGDATVLDLSAGHAWSVPAIGFQGLDPLTQDGDRQYRFDGLEYAGFPAGLATNFFAPGPETTGELILFSLDGTADVSPVPAALRVLFYDDDETERDASFDYDCFTVVALEEIDPRFAAAALGSAAGHVTLEPRAVSVATTHELTGTGTDLFRSTPTHGWYLAGFGANGEGAAARPLVQSITGHVPLTGDVTNFDAR